MYLFFTGENKNKIYLKLSETDKQFFADERDAVVNNAVDCKFNQNLGCYEMSIRVADFNIQKLSTYGEISVSEKAIEALDEFKARIKQLRPATRRICYNQKYLTYPWLVGKGENKDFQKEDLFKALGQNRFVFAHDTGLGKSWTMTALMSHLYALGIVKRFIVCSSNIGVQNVADEILLHSQVFKKEDMRVITSIAGLPDEDRLIFDKERFPQKIIVCTYNVIKAAGFAYYDKKNGTPKKPHPSDITNVSVVPWNDDIDSWFETDKGFQGCFMMDEAHTINIAQSKVSVICNLLAQQCYYRYLFSGTIADKVEKLYMVANLTDPWLVGGMTYNEWSSAYNEKGTKISKYAINPMGWDTEYIGWLNEQLVTTYGSKRIFDECMDVEEAIRLDPINVIMKPEHRAIYEMASNATLSSYQAEAEAKGKTLSLAATPQKFQPMHMAVDNPACLLDSKLMEKFSPILREMIQKFADKGIEGLSKWDLLLHILDRHYFNLNEKGIVWCYHPRTREMLVKGLEDKGVKVFTLSAEMKSEDRVPYLNTFKEYKGRAILVAPITIANSSVTLVEATWEFFFEKVYSYKDYKQSLGRIHRATKTKASYTYSALYANSIDFLQESNLQQKGNLLSNLMNIMFISGDKWKEFFNLNHVITSL